MAKSAVQIAEERLQNQERSIPSQANQDAIQYVWYAAGNITHRDLGKDAIQRLRWTPIVRAEAWVSIASKPNPSDFVAVRNQRAEMLRIRPLPPPTHGLIWKKPGAIATSIQEEFGEWGVLVSPTLAQIGSTNNLDVFKALNLNGIFFPMADNDLPSTYAGVRERIARVMQAFETGKLESLTTAKTARQYKELPVAQAKMVQAVGVEMLEALERTRLYQERHLDYTHQEFEKSKTETGHKGVYGTKERQMMSWLEVVPQDEVINRNAQANMTLIELAKQQLVNGAQSQSIDYTALGEGIAKGLMQAGVLAAPKPEEEAKPETKPEKK